MKNKLEKELIELINLHDDIAEFGSSEDSVDNTWLIKAEEKLGVKFSDSYIWFLKNYSGGEICGDEIYSIYGEEFESINGGDIVYQHLVKLKNNLTVPEKIIVHETDFGEIFFFNYSKLDCGECPIFLRLPSGDEIIYANNFYEFLKKRIEACLE